MATQRIATLGSSAGHGRGEAVNTAAKRVPAPEFGRTPYDDVFIISYRRLECVSFLPWMRCGVDVPASPESGQSL